jgi:hypothetical protein
MIGNNGGGVIQKERLRKKGIEEWIEGKKE